MGSNSLKRQKIRSNRKKILKARATRELMSNQLNKQLSNHKQKLIDNNDMDMINKHMKVMRDLLKEGLSFSNSHSQAQSQYPMN